MPTKELAHVTFPRHVMTPGFISAINTNALDMLNYESALFYCDIANGNFGPGIGVTLTMQEADLSTGPWTAVDASFTEWFQDGVPGNADISNQWTPAVPGHGGPLTLSNVIFDAHVYVCSYVGGLHRYLRMNVAPIGAPTETIAILAVLDSPRETKPRSFTNYPNDLGVGNWS